jgi:ABC-type Mn2+/Zn2+ transport system ATPase subunit
VTNVHARDLAVGHGHGHHPVVQHIDLDLLPGDLLVLIGTNGSGKSTLLKTLAGLLAPMHGELTVLGAKPGSKPNEVAYLPQHPISTHTLPLRVHDVVAMGRYAELGLLRPMRGIDRQAVRTAMARTGADVVANETIRDLSGGQQQRAHLAQVIAREAKVMLLDEPTAGLDVNGRKLVAEIIAEERSKGCTVVLATHELSDADNATSVMLLAQRVVAMGPPREALRDDYLRECFGFTQPH